MFFAIHSLDIDEAVKLATSLTKCLLNLGKLCPLVMYEDRIQDKTRTELDVDNPYYNEAIESAKKIDFHVLSQTIKKSLINSGNVICINYYAYGKQEVTASSIIPCLELRNHEKGPFPDVLFHIVGKDETYDKKLVEFCHVNNVHRVEINPTSSKDIKLMLISVRHENNEYSFSNDKTIDLRIDKNGVSYDEDGFRAIGQV